MPKNPNKCATRFCRRDRAPRNKYCHKCHYHKKKERNPVNVAYRQLRSNADARGKDFDLTLEQFKNLCESTGYIEHKGKTADSFTIDRIENDKGYTIDNLRVISNAENAGKKNRRVVYCVETRSFVVVKSMAEQKPEGPF